MRLHRIHRTEILCAPFMFFWSSISHSELIFRRILIVSPKFHRNRHWSATLGDIEYNSFPLQSVPERTLYSTRWALNYCCDWKKTPQISIKGVCLVKSQVPFLLMRVMYCFLLISISAICAITTSPIIGPTNIPYFQIWIKVEGVKVFLLKVYLFSS